MTNNLEKLIQDTLGNLGNVSPDKLNALIQEAMKTFAALKEKGTSSDPKDREEALKTAIELKQALQAQTEALIKSTGIDPATFMSLAAKKQAFTPETWTELSEAKKELESLNNQAPTENKPKAPFHKKKKGPHIPG